MIFLFLFFNLLCGFLGSILGGQLLQETCIFTSGVESLNNFAWFFASIFELKMEGLVKKARASREEQGEDKEEKKA